MSKFLPSTILKITHWNITFSKQGQFRICSKNCMHTFLVAWNYVVIYVIVLCLLKKLIYYISFLCHSMLSVNINLVYFIGTWWWGSGDPVRGWEWQHPWYQHKLQQDGAGAVPTPVWGWSHDDQPLSLPQGYELSQQGGHH